MRPIGNKFHISDGGDIVKTSNGDIIPDDEPVFLLRGRDYLAIETLERYHHLCLCDGATDYQLDGIDESIDAFKRYAYANRDKMKQPGSTLGK